MNFAIREALRLIVEYGLEARFQGHRENSQILCDRLEDLDLPLIVPAERCLPSLTTVAVPGGIDDAEIRKRLLEEYNIEIAGGLD